MNACWYQRFLTIILILMLAACTAVKPPLELSPDGEIIQKAIALQLTQTETLLSEQLKATRPQLEISQIRVKLLEPIFVADLPTYHLQGSYNLKLNLPRQEVSQNKNRFDIYLQRQAEGKTWRLLRRQISSESNQLQWFSYLIE